MYSRPPQDNSNFFVMILFFISAIIWLGLIILSSYQAS